MAIITGRQDRRGSLVCPNSSENLKCCGYLYDFCVQAPELISGYFQSVSCLVRCRFPCEMAGGSLECPTTDKWVEGSSLCSPGEKVLAQKLF